MSWSRSDKISAIALVLSVISILVAGGFSYATYRAQYSENLKIELLKPDGDHKVVPYKIRRDKTDGVVVKEIGAWYGVRLSNLSNKPISIVESFYKFDGSRTWENLPQPYVGQVSHLDKLPKYVNYGFFPIMLGVGESVNIEVFLPSPIKKDLGREIVGAFREKDDVIDSQIEFILFYDQYFDELEDKILEGMKQGKISELIEFYKPNIDGMDAVRLPFIENDDLSYTARDSEDNKDGFVYVESLSLYNKMIERMLEVEGMDISAVEPPIEGVDLVLQTASGEMYSLTLSFNENSLSRLK
ncbi:hypothetical protein OA92_20820 [Marinomonas sp. SBI22]|uniref:hypothetical protein n=1 Tax=unclassified Marinomonas TaxID=196814 RepID=UPI0007AF7EFE|nr:MULTISPECIES: hypothetical protein [unclassified Marinomonas]KZM39334.1 hypothetical protein OA92_20820 [Marinomonas sp. SBI22]KZM40119.1 hypothetical protein OA91_20040 [Marinomonas sp. SBI8L]